jgi:hypothetical protein
MRGKTRVASVPGMALVAMLASAGALVETLADEAPAASSQAAGPPAVVYLRGFVDMEKLRQANPNHYSRAERIIAASTELCKPGPDQVYYASFDAKNISCEGSLLRTSNPPKREIGFTLDEVRYIALITVEEGRPRFIQVPAPAEQAPLPVDPAK